MKAKVNRMLNSFRVKTGYNYREKCSFNYEKQLNRVIICIIIIIAVLILKKIDISFTNNIIRIVEETLNYTYDIKEDSIEVFNYVKNKLKLSDDAIPVYNNGISSIEKSNTFAFFL